MFERIDCMEGDIKYLLQWIVKDQTAEGYSINELNEEVLEIAKKYDVDLNEFAI